jgi:CRP-like cAMP-binding protein
MKKGDIGNEMYVSIKGRLGIYLEDFDLKKQPAHIVEEFNVVGEKSLEYSNVPRNATVVCLDEDETICLEITR